VNELPQTSQTHARASVCVVIAVADEQEHLRECVESVDARTPADVTRLIVAPTPAAVNRALEQLAPADVIVLSAPCRVTPGWLERLREAAREDSNTATASALADVGTELALFGESERVGTAQELVEQAEGLAVHTLRLRARLSCAVGPCVYVRREALELVGALDEELDLRSALEVDFAQRCLLSGLAHVAADDVLVQPLAPARDGMQELPAVLAARYPYLSEPPAVADSDVLALALQAARGPSRRLWVTLDARALDGAVTGTQVHILELIVALAHTGQLRLRLLVRIERIDRATMELLRGLPATEILAFEDLEPSTARSTVFHRPQQTFSAGDVALALALGERFVLSQLDLIAYRNPGYFADADTWQDYRRASRHGMSAAERVVVFSEHTRRELLSDALVEDARIRVVAPGLDHRASSEQRRPAALQGDEDGAKSQLADGFLLCLGTDFRHKNRLFALRLLAALREQHGWTGSLVLAGTHIPVGSSLALEHEFLREHPELQDAVVTLGPVSEAEKAWLLARAGAVVYPSVYEGFGLVPFEAALSGVPCVFAPQSSLAEEAPAGTATILPWDARASAASVHALLTNPAVRSSQIRKLAAAAGELSWASAAAATVDVYRQAAVAPVRDAATLSRDMVRREARLSVEHEIEAAQLVREREHAQRMYDELNADVGFGLKLIGPQGTLPEGLQRALLALSAHPTISRPLFGLLSRAFLAGRALARILRPRSREAS
jgi:glycosyltransferase involved in cell wall biosynthesis